MNCREFEASVIDLARDQVPAAATRAQALQHAEVCADCGTRLAQERALLAGMRLVVDDLAPQEAPARLEAILLAAFHAQAEQKPTAAPLAAHARWWSWQWAAAATAILLLVGLGELWRSLETKEQRQEVKQPPASPNAPASQTASTTDHARPSSEPLPMRVTTRRAPPRRGVRLPLAPLPEEISAPFYSLVEEGQMAPLESGRIVRIEVPAAELVKLGVPLTDTTLTQPMQADLLLGQDGLARAIRFVPNSQTTRMQ